MAGHLHIDCFSGVSGDMTLAALLDLGVPESLVQEALESLQLPGKLRVEQVKKNGFAARRVVVEAEPEKAHRHLRHIVEIVQRGNMKPSAKDLALKMFQVLAEAEAQSHGTTVEKVHFHEVGAIDSIFDFVGIAVALDWLAPERVTCRPVPTGNGFVDCEHGRMPVPAPAVANLLRGIPLAPTSIQSELTTPTGAAFLKVVVDQFLEQPPMTIENIGIGAGARNLVEQPNLLRLFLGTSNPNAQHADLVWQLETNLDDQSGEILAYCTQKLLDAGALDVWAVPITMKKSRPAVQISVLCQHADILVMEQILFSETGTFGIRRYQVSRSKRLRHSIELPTRWGNVRVKVGQAGSDTVQTPEYEDCARIAAEHNVPLRVVYREIDRLLQHENANTCG